MNLTRKFGVEIEFLAPDNMGQRTIAQTLTDQTGINVVSEYLSHDDRDYWKLVTDGSCGFELVSPPLSGEDGFNEITRLSAALIGIGIKVNKSCGLHVHVDARDLTKRELASITATYARFERFFDALVPESRRRNNNRYCESVRDLVTRTMYHEDFKRNPFETFDVVMASTGRDPRYHKVNLDAYARHGTIEFRQHSGTVEAEKIINWVVLMLTLVEVSRSAYVNLKDVQVSVEIVKNWLGISNRNADKRIAECSRWINTRFSKFNPGLSYSSVL